ncbi:uncharacterized protein LOC131618929 [Vicia villosa]|uniref:uncharacterized protein LOC131618929 n=1 Tax=Vicia villosa TaxID=3911 RepID=UPI00273C97D0|nr:uncharacterized protein LOC131618929 [Vicia villosa]
MGFEEIWLKWIEVMVFSSHMSVMVNGSPTKEFLVEKGLRQGDPFSPFLFMVVAEGLKRIINKAVENGSYAGFSINRRCFIDVLQFADDTLMVGDGSWKHLWAIKAVLRGFELISGLGINFNMSKLIGLNIDSCFLEVATTFLACRREDKIFKFLGVYIGCNSRRIILWETLMSNIKKRLASWKGRLLSFGGRLTLLKPVLGSLAIFTLSFYKALKKVVEEITKWKWRILEEEGSLWHEVLKARYGSASYIKGKEFTSVWWTDILALDNQVAKDFFNHQCRMYPLLRWGDCVMAFGCGKFWSFDRTPECRFCNCRNGADATSYQLSVASLPRFRQSRVDTKFRWQIYGSGLFQKDK